MPQYEEQYLVLRAELLSARSLKSPFLEKASIYFRLLESSKILAVRTMKEVSAVPVTQVTNHKAQLLLMKSQSVKKLTVKLVTFGIKVALIRTNVTLKEKWPEFF